MTLTSMTGHGVGRATLTGSSEQGDGRRVVVEIRTVNHRYLDVRLRTPSELSEHSAAIEAAIRGALSRGRVEASVQLEGSRSHGVELDVIRARRAYEQLSALRDELSPGEPVPLSLLAAVPELFAVREEAESEGLLEALLAAVTEALSAVRAMRDREGSALARELTEQLAGFEGELAAVTERAPRVVLEYRDKLRDRLDVLLSTSEASLDPGRLEQEVALFADRADIAEELARLTSHVEQMSAILDEGGLGAGKRIDFLLQEMGRETNTIGSKCSDAALAHRVIEMKAAIGRMREQIQNVA